VKLKLNFIEETEKARLFEMPKLGHIWIPRSVIKTQRKFPEVNGKTVCVVEVEDWFVRRNKVLEKCEV